MTILYFEDDKFLREMYKTALTRRGFEIEEHEYPTKDILNKISKDRYDLIIMDDNMPKTNGYRATRLIRQDKKAGNIPIIMMSNSGYYDETRSKALEAGADELFIKAECSPIQLSKKLKQLQREKVDLAT